MKKIILLSLLVLGISGIANAQYRVFDSGQVGTSPVTNYYLKTDGKNSFWAAVTGGSGGGAGTFSTSTAWGSILYNFPNNLTDILAIGYDGSGIATSSDAEFVLDPVAKLALFLNSTKVGIGTTSPWRTFAVNGSSDLGTNALAGYFTATTTTASVFPSANITKLSNLTSNGFVKTGSADGTLSVDTTTYESGLTAGDGLTRTVNDFDCDTASGSVFGCLASADWTTFNNKQASGNYITALTGDVTATGPGSVAATLATVNANVGSYTNANITVNAKGLITAAANGTAGSGGSGNVATSSAETAGQLPYWTSTGATPATLGGVATTSVTCSGSTTCDPFTVIGASPITISSTGGVGSSGGTWSTTTSTVSGQLTNYPNNDDDIVTIGSNSTTTSEFYFDPNTKTAVLGLDTGFLGGRVYKNGLFGTESQAMLTEPVNDLQSNLVIGNTYSGADGVYATGGITFVNGRSTQGATFQTSDYYTYMGLAGPNFATFTGLPPNGFVLSNTDGPVIIGATSANVASSTLAFAIGSGYAVGNYDMILKNVDASYTNTASGGLGIGTSTPDSRITILASSTAPFNYLTVYQHVNGVTTGIPVFNVNKNENVGIASTTPWGRLSINPIAGVTGPSFVVGSSTKTTFIVDNGGKTGVGLTTPTAKLTVQGDGTTTGTAFQVQNSTPAAKLTMLDNGQTRLSSSASAIAQDTLLELIGSAAGTGFSTETLFKLVRPSAALEYTKVFGIGVGKGSDSSNLTSNTRVDFLVKTTASTGNDPTTVAMTIWGRPVMSPLIGIGSTTPWGQLSVNPTAGLTGPAFVIGSSTRTHFMVNNDGNIGIGTTTTTNAKITVDGSASATTTVRWGGKKQEEYYNSAGSLVCEFINGTTQVIQSGACNY